MKNLYKQTPIFFLLSCIFLSGVFISLSSHNWTRGTRISKEHLPNREIANNPVHAQCRGPLRMLSECRHHDTQCVARIFSALAYEVDTQNFTMRDWENCMTEGLSQWTRNIATPVLSPQTSVIADQGPQTVTIMNPPLTFNLPRAYFSLDRCEGVAVYIDHGAGRRALPNDLESVPARSTCQLQIYPALTSTPRAHRQNGCMPHTCQYLGETRTLNTALPYMRP